MKPFCMTWWMYKILLDIEEKANEALSKCDVKRWQYFSDLRFWVINRIIKKYGE